MEGLEHHVVSTIVEENKKGDSTKKCLQFFVAQGSLRVVKYVKCSGTESILVKDHQV